MAITFNPDEVFEMAIEIERRGARFYRHAAENSQDAKAVEMFLNLCEMEKGHESTFVEMRKELAAQNRESSVFDPDNEAVYYLKALAASHGWEGKAAKTMEFTGQERPDQVYKIAIEAEKQSIDFYVGLKELVASQSAKDKVQAIIREEMAHLVSLIKALKALGPAH
ncbi:MAG TPA: ferritin family protein [Sedimentisphaerales bacterium]|nr:ferritin family protein [Sedimentisphaerales bacterium]